VKKYLFIILFLSLLALWPFFKKGYFETHDGQWWIIRFSAFHQTLVAGQFPVRFVDRLNNNYGYPVLNFDYPLPFYLAEVPKIIGFGFADSIKIVFVASAIFSSIAMYWALSQVFSNEAALAGSILYLYTPYRFVDLYVRGSIGENLAFAIAPVILGLILKLRKGNDIFLPFLAISIASLVLAHNVMAFLYLPALFIIALIMLKSKIKVIVSFFAGLAVSSFFWIPAIYDLQYIRLSRINVSNISDHLVFLKYLFVPNWGYGPIPKTASSNGLSVQIGLVSFCVIILSIYIAFKNRDKLRIIWFLVTTVCISIFLMTKTSMWFWLNVPFAYIIQFPWRLLGYIIFSVSILGAYVIDVSNKRKFAAYLIILASIISTIFYIRPEHFNNLPDSYYSTNESTSTINDEYMPIWVLEKPERRALQKIEVEAPGEIVSSDIKPAKYQALIRTPNEVDVKVNTIYFPGWQVDVDGTRQTIDYQNKHGLITFPLPKGRHEVIIKYGKTPVHLASEIMSLLALIGTGGYLYFLWRRQNQK